ncbi:MAG: hypothetical protein IJ459_02145 [Clostridia bacterium]|nr:hypothetical protein [Clostridia bacterium]
MPRIFFRLTFALCLFMLLALISACSAAPSEEDGDGQTSDGTSPEIKLPDGDGEVRDSVHFDDIVYSRPDVENLCGVIGSAVEAVENNELSFEEQIEKIRAIEPLYAELRTMHTYSMIKTYENSNDPKYSVEFSYLEEQMPSVAKLLEDLMVAAALSPHAERFESDYFGEGLIEKYAGGGKYTDELVELFEKEAALEAQYTSVSTATVKISYDGVTDTYDNIVSSLKEKYNEGSSAYLSAVAYCNSEYRKASERLLTDIFIKLVEVRGRIAEAMGYASYVEYAYEVLGHDYSVPDTEEMLLDIAEYITPIYSTLYTRVFSRNTGNGNSVNSATVLNTLSGVLGELDGELLEVYNYMLTYGLFDVDAPSSVRYEGAFTTYLDSYLSPYMFVTASGYSDDYMTVAHEFGHYYDYYLNGSTGASIDLMEVSSQGLELMVLLNLEEALSWQDYKKLYYGQMEDILSVFILQGFYAKFEHIVYSLPYDEISEKAIDVAVAEAAREMNLNDKVFCDFSTVMIPHIFVEPLYVQSYCTSLAASLEIFFAEMNREGEGYEMYKEVLRREGYTDFEEQLREAGLNSPFEDGVIKKLADSIYYSLIGAHYFEEYKGSANSVFIPYIERNRLCAA